MNFIKIEKGKIWMEGSFLIGLLFDEKGKFV